MSTKLREEPAFPKQTLPEFGQVGMSKRFYAACAAMQGLFSNPDSDTYAIGNGEKTDSFENKIKFCYLAADELLKQENEAN